MRKIELPNYPTNNTNGRVNNNSFYYKTNEVNKEIQFINNQYMKSPSALLTPGRKSASPTFFHSNFNGSLNNNHNETIYQLNQDSSLKIPTTPTRSKSLSPSLRGIIQPPRMRHKNLTYSTLSNNVFKPIINTNNTKPVIPQSDDIKLKSEAPIVNIQTVENTDDKNSNSDNLISNFESSTLLNTSDQAEEEEDEVKKIKINEIIKTVSLFHFKLIIEF